MSLQKTAHPLSLPTGNESQIASCKGKASYAKRSLRRIKPIGKRASICESAKAVAIPLKLQMLCISVAQLQPCGCWPYSSRALTAARTHAPPFGRGKRKPSNKIGKARKTDVSGWQKGLHCRLSPGNGAASAITASQSAGSVIYWLPHTPRGPPRAEQYRTSTARGGEGQGEYEVLACTNSS